MDPLRAAGRRVGDSVFLPLPPPPPPPPPPMAEGALRVLVTLIVSSAAGLEEEKNGLIPRMGVAPRRESLGVC